MNLTRQLLSFTMVNVHSLTMSFTCFIIYLFMRRLCYLALASVVFESGCMLYVLSVCLPSLIINNPCEFFNLHLSQFNS